MATTGLGPANVIPGNKVFSRVNDACPTGGYKSEDWDQIKAQREVAWDLIKQMGQNLTNGRSIINVTMPARIFEPRSYLQRIADGWCYAPIYLTQAAMTPDPLDRMKHVITFAIAGLSNTCTQKKPFNPILGETFQATYEDGAYVYTEQSSHHPPVTNWQVIGPDGLYHFYGYGEWTAAFRGNSVRGHQKGPHFLEFRDGGKVVYNLPEIWVKGIMLGDRIVEYDGLMKFRDEQNNLGCDLTINPPQSGGGFFGWGKKKNPTDYFQGTIFKSKTGNLEDETSREILSVTEGSWLGSIEFDGKPTWDWQLGLPVSIPKPIDNPLPSDSRFREDLVALQNGDIDLANEMKITLENKQRRDAKLRKEGYEKRGQPQQH